MKKQTRKLYLSIGTALVGASLLATTLVVSNNQKSLQLSNFSTQFRASGLSVLGNKIPEKLNPDKSITTRYQMKDDLDVSNLSASLGDGSFIYVTDDGRLVREWIDPSQQPKEYPILGEDAISIADQIIDMKYDALKEKLILLWASENNDLFIGVLDIKTGNIYKNQLSGYSQNDAKNYALFEILNKVGEFVVAPKAGAPMTIKGQREYWQSLSIRIDYDYETISDVVSNKFKVNSFFNRYIYSCSVAFLNDKYYVFAINYDERQIFEIFVFEVDDLFVDNQEISYKSDTKLDKDNKRESSNWNGVKINHEIAMFNEPDSNVLKLSYVFPGQSSYIYKIDFDTNKFLNPEFYDLANESSLNKIDIFKTYTYKHNIIFLGKESKFESPEAPLGINLYVLNGSIDKDFEDDTWALPYNSQWIKYLDKTLVEDQCKFNYNDLTDYSKISLLPISLNASSFDSGIYAISQSSKKVWNFDLSNNVKDKWKLGSGIIEKQNLPSNNKSNSNSNKITGATLLTIGCVILVAVAVVMSINYSKNKKIN